MLRLAIVICVILVPLNLASGVDGKKSESVPTSKKLDPKLKQEIERAKIEARKLYDAGKKEEALVKYTKIAESLLQSLGPHQVETLDTQVSVIAILLSLERYEEVDRMANRCLSITSKMKPSPKEIMMQLHNAKVGVAIKNGDYNTSAKHSQAAYQIAIDIFGMEDERTWAYGLVLANGHYQLGNYWLCEVLARPILQFQRDSGAQDNSLEEALSHVAYCQYFRGDFEGAAGLLRELLLIRQAKDGEMDYATIDTLGKYANCFDSLGEENFAQSIHTRWLRLNSRYRAEKRKDLTPRMILEIGGHSLAVGEFEDAEKWFTRWIALPVENREPDDLAAATRHLAICKNRLTKAAEAEALARNYLQNFAETESSHRITEVKIELAMSLLALGKRDEAISIRNSLAGDSALKPYFKFFINLNGDNLIDLPVTILGKSGPLVKIKSRYDEFCSQIDGAEHVAEDIPSATDLQPRVR